jgi:hypothetical protein
MKYWRLEKILLAKFNFNDQAKNIWACHIARLGNKRNTCMILIGKPEGKKPLQRPTHRWVDNIKMDLTEIGWGDMDWIDLAQDRDKWKTLKNKVMNLWVP